MARFGGKIGFAVMTKSDGVVIEEIIERTYYGDVTRNARRLETSGNLNDDISLTNSISIVADPYANENFHNIRYVEWMGSKWKATNVDVAYPRLNITLGGVWNGE
ncbi:MAG: hypothetical protein HUJ78_01160 [Mogibacterium sp.]|nr:hypothetical protein [Mogibacterium sp.]MCF0232930.1 hypothetical protein [Enterococcus sp.]